MVFLFNIYLLNSLITYKQKAMTLKSLPNFILYFTFFTQSINFHSMMCYVKVCNVLS